MLSVTHPNRPFRRSITLASIALSTLLLTSCAAADGEAATGPGAEVTLVVHSSFPNEEFASAASAATGYTVTVVTVGSGEELTNKLALTSGAPLGDAFFGVDNVYASRVVSAGVADPYLSPELPESASSLLVDQQGSLSPITRGATCVNIDPAWFAEHGIAEPVSYEDLATPTYAPLTVLMDPSSSSTGASFLIGTVAHFGESGFAEYWQQLLDNGARIEQSWSDAYNGQFTQGGGSGTKPIVVSYSTSPAWTVNDAGTESTTASLMNTCSTQVEYAGVLAGAKNPEGAQAVIDYLLSPEFQSTIPETMYVYPVDTSVALPAVWQQFADFPEAPNDVDPNVVGDNRDAWLREWSEATGW